MICSQSWSDIEDSGFHSNIDGREILDDSTSVSAPANIDCKVTLNTTKHIIHRDIKQLIYIPWRFIRYIHIWKFTWIQQGTLDGDGQ